MCSSDEFLSLSTKYKIDVKTNVIDGSVVNAIREPVLFSFVLNKPSGYKTKIEPQTIEQRKIKKSVMNTITFYLENLIQIETEQLRNKRIFIYFPYCLFIFLLRATLKLI